MYKRGVKMNRIRIFLPIIVNYIVTFLYWLLCCFGLQFWDVPDSVLYIDGREEYCFGIGHWSVVGLIIVLVITIIVIVSKKGLFAIKEKYSRYCFVSIGLVVLMDVFWMLYYIDWFIYPLFI